MAWLQRRGLLLVDQAIVEGALRRRGVILTGTSADVSQILQAAEELNITTVVIVESASDESQETRAVGPVTIGAYERSAYLDSYTSYSSLVSVRAVNPVGGAVEWSGTARYPVRVTGAIDDAFVKLTCQALATAWGYRPVGGAEISSTEMCEVSGSRPGR